MNVKIREDGSLHQLVIKDRLTGIDFTNDLIGNAGAFADHQFIWSEDDDAYLVYRLTFEWWLRYIDDTLQTEREALILAHRLNMDLGDVQAMIDANCGPDYAAHRYQALRTMREIELDFSPTGELPC